MLDTARAACALYSQPEIKFTVDAYRRRLKILMSFDYNTNVVSPLLLYTKIIQLSERIDNLNMLYRVLASSYNLLKDEQKNIIRLFYFERAQKENILSALSLSENQFKNKKRAALKKAAVLLDILGLSDEKFLTLFNDEPLLVRNYGYTLALKLKNSGKSFKRVADEEY